MGLGVGAAACPPFAGIIAGIFITFPRMKGLREGVFLAQPGCWGWPGQDAGRQRGSPCG